MTDPDPGEITIEEFSRVNLVIGKVVEVSDHPRADKLCLIKVDTGDRVRQTVAGLKPYMDVSKLVGREVVVVANLRPAVLRGERSEGMILAAQNGDQVVLLTTESEVGPGSTVR